MNDSAKLSVLDRKIKRCNMRLIRARTTVAKLEAQKMRLQHQLSTQRVAKIEVKIRALKHQLADHERSLASLDES